VPIVRNMKNNEQDRQNPEAACGVRASGVIGGRGKDKELKPGKLKYVYRAIESPAPQHTGPSTHPNTYHYHTTTKVFMR